MDKFTKARQALGKAIYNQLKKDPGGGPAVRLKFDNVMYFYATRSPYNKDGTYTYEMGFRYCDGDDGLMAVRTTYLGVEDAVSQRTTVEDLELAMQYMPAVEKFLDVKLS